MRIVCSCYIHFRANNTMEACTINATGVGQYDASEPIEAENYFELRGDGAKVDLLAEGDDDGDTGFAVALRPSSELHYPNIRVPAGSAPKADEALELELTLHLASAAASGSATVLASNAAGRLLGSVAVASTESWTRYNPLSMALKLPRSALDEDGDLDLVLSLDSSISAICSSMSVEE